MKFLKSTGGFLTCVFILWLLIYFGQDDLGIKVSLFWIVLYLSFYLLFLSFSKATCLHKYKRNLWTVIIFLIIHVVVFPSIYVDILRDNPKSFEFDDYIEKSEREFSLKQIIKDYSPSQINKNIDLINSILETDSIGRLDTKIEHLRAGNILKVDDYQFYVDIKEAERLPNQDPETFLIFELRICNSDGLLIGSVYNDYLFNDKITYQNSIRNLLERKVRDLKLKLEDYENDRKVIETDNVFWTYDKILPYSINIFNTSNINPKSRLANNLIWVHKVLLGIIGLIITFFISRTKSNKVTES